MHKAVVHLQDEFGGGAHRPRDAGARREAAGRLLRHRGPAAAARRLLACPSRGCSSISPYDKGAIKAIEKAIQPSDLGVNPINDGADHPAHVPRAHRGAPQGAGEGREATGPRRAGSRSATCAATPARSSRGSRRTARSARTSSTGSRRTSRSAPTRSIAEIDDAAQAQGEGAARGLTPARSEPSSGSATRADGRRSVLASDARVRSEERGSTWDDGAELLTA